MTRAGIAPGPSGYDFHTFECATCDHAHTALAVNDPMKSGTQGWLDGEHMTYGKRVKRSLDVRGFELNADEALEAARNMAPGPERNDALKKAGPLRNTADVHGLIFARRGRPPR
jgi:hypothetical protein